METLQPRPFLKVTSLDSSPASWVKVRVKCWKREAVFPKTNGQEEHISVCNNCHIFVPVLQCAHSCLCQGRTRRISTVTFSSLRSVWHMRCEHRHISFDKNKCQSVLFQIATINYLRYKIHLKSESMFFDSNVESLNKRFSLFTTRFKIELE